MQLLCQLMGMGTLYPHAGLLSINDNCEQLMQYPATLNTCWIQQFYAISIVRNWVANVKLTTLAGTFNCMKLDVSGAPLGNGHDPVSEIVIIQLKSVNF